MQRVTEFDRKPEDGIIISISGQVKTGKSYMAAHAGYPLYYHEWDQGGFDRIKPYLDRKAEIYRETYPLTAWETQTAAQKLWDHFVEEYLSGLKATDAGAGWNIVDTESLVWPCIQTAYVNPNGKRGAMEYGPANAQYRKMLGVARKYKANLILLHQSKAVWEKDERGNWQETDRQEPVSHKECEALVDLRIETLKPYSVLADKTAFRAKITFCGIDPTMEGTVFDPTGKTPGPADKIIKSPATLQNILGELGLS